MGAVTGVPAGNVGQVTQDYVDAGEALVTARRDPDGSWTVSAGATRRFTPPSRTRKSPAKPARRRAKKTAKRSRRPGR